MWATAGTPIDFPVSYLVDEDFVIPSTATATVRDQAGAVVHTSTLDTSTTSAVLSIPATEISAGRDFETLFVQVRFIVNGRLHEQSHTIYLTPFVPLTATAADVRQILGIPPTELEDGQIRIYPAYFRLAPQIGPALTAGNAQALAANRAVALEAALELIPSLELRIGQKLKSEDQEFSRFSDIDWVALQLALEAELEELLAAITDSEVEAISHFAWSFPTDPITGA